MRIICGAGGRRLRFGALIVAAGLVAVFPLASSAASASPGAWRNTSAPVFAPSGDHTATLLKDGRVLIVGGATCGAGCGGTEVPTSSAEVYEPAADRWTATGSTSVPRENHIATLLRDGRVLVAGGLVNSVVGTLTATAEVYSPATGRWVGAGSMRVARFGHAASLLPDGRVLVTGGISRTLGPDGKPMGFAWEASAELFDPVAGRWNDAAPMGFGRSDHTSTLLRDGTVLVAGGRNSLGRHPAPDDSPALRIAELFTPTTGVWTPVPHFLHTPRVNHTATLLPDGTVMLAGGAIRFYHGGTSDPTDTVEIYHPTSRSLTDAPKMPQARFAHSATLLDDGRVLIAGGIRPGDNVRSGLQHHTPAAPELYDPVAQTWFPAAPDITDPSTHGQRGAIEYMLAGNHAATLLPDGRVLVLGGDAGPRSAQLFDPAGSTGGATGQAGSGHALAWGAAAAGLVAVAAGGLAVVWRRRRGSGEEPPSAAR